MHCLRLDTAQLTQLQDTFHSLKNEFDLPSCSIQPDRHLAIPYRGIQGRHEQEPSSQVERLFLDLSSMSMGFFLSFFSCLLRLLRRQRLSEDTNPIEVLGVLTNGLAFMSAFSLLFQPGDDLQRRSVFFL